MKKNIYFIVISIVVVLVITIGALIVYHRENPVNQQPSYNQQADTSNVPVLFVRSHSPVLGPQAAKVEIVEFLDPECESCRAMHPIIKRILKDYEGRVRYVIRYMSFHKNSIVAAAALQGAAKQNKYWQLLDLLFEKQPEWGESQSPQTDLILSYAKSLGIDTNRLMDDLHDPVIRDQISIDMDDGQKVGVRATPTIFVNGQMLYELGDKELRELIESKMRQ